MSTSPHNGRQVGDAVDSSYFSRYGLLDIHEDMLKDRSRTETYRDAMESPIGKEDFKGNQCSCFYLLSAA